MSTQIAVTGITFADGTSQNTATPTIVYAANNTILEGGQAINTNYTMPAGKNGLTAGPITINTGFTVTIPTGSTWSII
jgi:hypothetical protein